MRTRSLVLLIIAGAIPLFAEHGFLVLRVTDTSKRPVARVLIGIKEDSATSVTDDSGIARIRLRPGVNPGEWVTIRILKASRPLVIVSPWDERLQVPPSEKEANYASVVVAF